MFHYNVNTQLHGVIIIILSKYALKTKVHRDIFKHGIISTYILTMPFTK